MEDKAKDVILRPDTLKILPKVKCQGHIGRTLQSGANIVNNC